MTFIFENGTRNYYACINISLIVFNAMRERGELAQLIEIDVRCAECGMLMRWDDPMVVWIYQPNYLCPTTGTPTIVAVCSGLCTDHFLDQYGGQVVDNPFEWEA